MSCTDPVIITAIVTSLGWVVGLLIHSTIKTKLAQMRLPTTTSTTINTVANKALSVEISDDIDKNTINNNESVGEPDQEPTLQGILSYNRGQNNLKLSNNVSNTQLSATSMIEAYVDETGKIIINDPKSSKLDKKLSDINESVDHGNSFQERLFNDFLGEPTTTAQSAQSGHTLPTAHTYTHTYMSNHLSTHISGVSGLNLTEPKQSKYGKYSKHNKHISDITDMSGYQDLYIGDDNTVITENHNNNYKKSKLSLKPNHTHNISATTNTNTVIVHGMNDIDIETVNSQITENKTNYGTIQRPYIDSNPSNAVSHAPTGNTGNVVASEETNKLQTTGQSHAPMMQLPRGTFKKSLILSFKRNDINLSDLQINGVSGQLRNTIYQNIYNWLATQLINVNLNEKNQLIQKIILQLDIDRVTGHVILVLDQELLQTVGISKENIGQNILALATQ